MNRPCAPSCSASSNSPATPAPWRQSHKTVIRRQENSLLARLDANERNLRAFNRATRGLDPGYRLTPAAEWMLDNFYLIEEQIQMAKRHLPRGYSRELPRLLERPFRRPAARL